MKLNKKYEPQLKPFSSIPKNPDFFFPVFLSSFQKVGGMAFAELMVQAIARQQTAQNLGKTIAPFFIKGADISGMGLLLKGKEHLPLPAKLQRCSSHELKLLTKARPFLAQLFSQQDQTSFFSFQVSNPKVQHLFREFQDKNLRKQTQELVYRDICSKTIVPPDGIEWRKEKQLQLEVKCFVETKNDVFPLVIEDPLLLFSDVGVIVHENDKRYKKHIGKRLIIPVINKSIPIFGEEGHDTVKDNGIQRLNPLLSPQILEKTKAYGLPLQENYIDENGLFGDKVANFGGKSVFEFTANIVETLATIGNLLSQQEVLQEVPYSKETGQRLIKKVVSTITLDLSSLQSDFFLWLEEHFPERVIQADLFCEEDFTLLIENRNPYTQKLSFLEDKEGHLNLFDLAEFSKTAPSLLAVFLLDQLRKGHLPPVFTLSELIDMLFLTPEQERNALSDQLPSVSQPELLAIPKHLKTLGSETLVEMLHQLLEQLPRIRAQDKDRFSFSAQHLRGGQTLHTLSCNDPFLQVLALLISADGNIALQVDTLGKGFLKMLLLLLFLTAGEKKLLFFAGTQAPLPVVALPEKYPKLIERYGRETLRLLLAQHQKPDENSLNETFEYLKHLRNLFKTLYETSAFSSFDVLPLHVGGKELWMLSQWRELQSGFENISVRSSEFPSQLEKLQNFTREQFTWFLALIKQEKNPESFLVAGQIFLGILEKLAPLIPEFLTMIERVFSSERPPLHKKEQYLGTKDYKIHLLFDILQGINHKKTELKLKKHLPIHLTIQANADILRLLESHEASLKLLFKTEEIRYLTTNEVFPSGFHSFSILDMTVGIKPCILSEQQDLLVQLEKEFKSKTQTLEYLRSTLMALSLSPLSDPVKISEKEAELEKLKSELQSLEIKIKKTKMEKKSG